jgi:hypothetical protein
VARNAQDQADAIAEVLQGHDQRLNRLEEQCFQEWEPEGLSANVRGLIRARWEAEKQFRLIDDWMTAHHGLIMELDKAKRGLGVSPRGGEGGGSA